MARGPCRRLFAIVQYDLGTVAGVPLGFTDAAALASGAVVFLAGAEDIPRTRRRTVPWPAAAWG